MRRVKTAQFLPSLYSLTVKAAGFITRPAAFHIFYLVKLVTSLKL
jgi:hypothetical protein